MFKLTLIYIDIVSNNVRFVDKFDNKWNQESFDKIYNVLQNIYVLQIYPKEIPVYIANYAMNWLFSKINKQFIDIMTIEKEMMKVVWLQENLTSSSSSHL